MSCEGDSPIDAVSFEQPQSSTDQKHALAVSTVVLLQLGKLNYICWPINAAA